MAIDKKYQVFVSSTFKDLHDERQEVMQAILEMNCIPSGMELFPAANDDQWTLIKRVIDDCDYYLVIVGGRYGSLTTDGISYTQKEYEYAAARGKPTIGFLHEKPEDIPVGKSDIDPAIRQKLREFRALCQKRTCKYWNSPADLGGKVSRALLNAINTHPAVGWVKGDKVLDEHTANTIISLRNENDELKRELLRLRTEPPPGTDKLAQGQDTFEVHFALGAQFSIERTRDARTMTWDLIFSSVAPCMMNEASEYAIAVLLGQTIRNKWFAQTGLAEQEVHIDRPTFNRILVQLRALGLITLSERKRGVKDRGTTYWSLTPYGSDYMNRLVAISKTK